MRYPIIFSLRRELDAIVGQHLNDTSGDGAPPGGGLAGRTPRSNFLGDPSKAFNPSLNLNLGYTPECDAVEQWDDPAHKAIAIEKNRKHQQNLQAARASNFKTNKFGEQINVVDDLCLTVEEMITYTTKNTSRAKPNWKPNCDFLLKQGGKK